MNGAVTLRPFSDLSIDEHRQLESQPDIGPFAIAPVMAMWSKVYGWNAQVLSCGSSRLPILIRQSVLGRIAFALPFGMYGFRLTGANREEFATILTAIQRQRFVQANVVVIGSLEGFDYPSRYDLTELKAHRIDLFGASMYSENTSRNVRKLDYSQLDFRLLDSSHTSLATKLLAEHVTRTEEKRRIMPGAYRHLLNHAGNSAPGIVVGGAFEGDTLLAAQIFFVSEIDAFYFDGFASERALTAGANFLIMDRMIQWLRERNIRTLNLGATPVGDEGLSRFKTGWGAQEFAYYEFATAAPWKRVLDSFRGR